MNSREKDEKFQRGILHFNAQEFFEAHEVWEEVWLVEAEPEKTFLQGIIQIAAAFHHYLRENPDGAVSSNCRVFPRIIAVWQSGTCAPRQNGGQEASAKAKKPDARRFHGCAGAIDTSMRL